MLMRAKIVALLVGISMKEKCKWLSGKFFLFIYSVFTVFSINANPLVNVSNLLLEDCHLEGIKAQLSCGYLTVPENYTLKPSSGLIDNKVTTIDIAFVVLPALDPSTKKSPIMLLTGGPGQAGVELAAQINYALADLGKSRDIILIDQRGTGKSHPLACTPEVELDPYSQASQLLAPQELEDCLAALTGDLRQYNTENAIRDFDAVRAALGYQQVNLYGVSYGTRAALTYMRMFPQAIRSVVLDGVIATGQPIGLFGQSTEQSFNLLLANCQKNSACQQAYPDLAKEFSQVNEQLAQSAVTVDIPHPRLGTRIQLVMDQAKFIHIINQQLYSADMRSLLPLAIHQASLGNFLPLVGLLAARGEQQKIYQALYFNIVCNEDFPRITPQDFVQDADNGFAGNLLQLPLQEVCPLWPKYQVSNDFTHLIKAKLPTLLLSGELDPVTPPSQGEKVAQQLTNSLHISVKNTGHGVVMSTCAIDIMKMFLDDLLVKPLDISCLEKVPEMSFITSLNGGIE